MIKLEITKRTDPRLIERMNIHYSQPKGFVGRNICYAIYYNDIYFGHIVAGSSTRFLPGRNEFFNIDISKLNNIVNNIFYSISKVDNKYPLRNFSSKVLDCFCEQVKTDWFNKYGDKVIGFETLVEKPRTGELYLKSNFIKVGETVGYTCKRISGKGTDSYTGRRVWDKINLRPKIVLCKKINDK